MAEQKFDSMMKKTLKNLCSNHGWCYGVVWGFDQRNSLLLTLKDCYYEEQMGALIDSLLLQAHVVGGGVIGQTAFAKNHQWLNSDAHHEMANCVGSFDSQEDSEFFSQFSMGIKISRSIIKKLKISPDKSVHSVFILSFPARIRRDNLQSDLQHVEEKWEREACWKDVWIGMNASG